MEIGGGAGLTGYLGDFNGKLTRDLQPMASVVARRLLNPWAGFKFNASWGKLKGSSADAESYLPEFRDDQLSPTREGLPYTFSNTLVDVSAVFEYNFLPYGTGRDYRGAKRLVPFIFGGLGGTFVNGGGKSTFTCNVPIGLGVKYKIADRLNEAGRYHKNGKWLPERVRRVLERKTYLGYVYYDGEWYEGSHEAFISEELFDKVQRLRARKSEEHKEHNRRSGMASSYLGGFLICKQCGRKYVKCMSTHTLKDGTKSVYHTYRCQTRAKKNKYYDDGVCSNRNWKMQELDGMVFDQIKKLRLEGVQAEPKMNDETVQSIQLKISDISEQIDRLLSLYSVGDIPLDAVQKKMQALTDQRSKLEDEVDRLQYDTKLSLSEVTPIVESFDEVLDCGDLDDIRTVIGSLIDRIELDGDDVSIYWRF